MDSDLLDVLDRLGEPRLLVLGDCMLDRCIRGAVERVCPEAPALVFSRDGEGVQPGGAARVATLASSLGARVTLAGVVGGDEDGRLLRGLLEGAGVDVEAVVACPDRPTTAKARYLGRAGGGPPSQLLRVDREGRADLPTPLEAELLESLAGRMGEFDAVLVADHAKGVCTPGLLGAVLLAALEACVPVLVDPARRADYSRYRGADGLLPNRGEAALASRRDVSSVEEGVAAANDLLDWPGVTTVLLKMDRDGMVLAQRGRPAGIYPGRARRVRDVTGAGDAVLAAAGLCRANGLPWDITARIASVAAGVQVERGSANPITRDDLIGSLVRHEPHARRKHATVAQVAALAEDYRWSGKRVVLTNGCFDLLHAGHAAYLEEAAALGDVLIVAVNRDNSVRRLKGLGRPLVGEADRAALIAALRCVDHVVLFDEETPHELLRLVRPDVLVKGGDYTAEQVVGREVVLAYGGQVRVTGRREGLSTTQMMSEVLRRCPLKAPV
jgi:D-beta-D-heptose 7-phosphate kinase/D-beta-D-heptose 1-phosphate adenosyltransferase